MKNLLLLMFFFSSALVVSAATNPWTLDRSHSNVRFTVNYLGVSEVDGRFMQFDGSMLSSKNDFTDAQISFTVAAASVNTENESRDKHLQSDDFFNAEKYPALSFKSTSFKKISETRYELEGDLTIRDVTKPVKFEVLYGGTVVDGYGNNRVGFVANTTINRFDYKLQWNKAVEATSVVDAQVNIRINAAFVQKK